VLGWQGRRLDVGGYGGFIVLIARIPAGGILALITGTSPGRRKGGANASAGSRPCS